MKKSPAAPPVYRPSPQPRVLQRKTAAAPALPIAPRVYRPQPLPKVLQRKTAGAPRIVARSLRSNTIQGVLIIDDEYFNSAHLVPTTVSQLSNPGKAALNAKSVKDHQQAIITQLNRWAENDKSEYEFKNWQLAAQAALAPQGIDPTRTFSKAISVAQDTVTDATPLQPPTPMQSGRRQEILDPLLAQVEDYEDQNPTSHGGQHMSLARSMSLTATAMERREKLESQSQKISKKDKKKEKVKIRHIEENAKRKEGPHNQGGGKGQL
jgi:hypothetical protein